MQSPCVTNCLNCFRFELSTGDFCIKCGHRAVVPASEADRTALAVVMFRVTTLDFAAKGIQTEKAQKSEFARFTSFMSRAYGTDASLALPWHIVAYLMSLDAGGLTIVHVPVCDCKDTKLSSRTCQCPRRMRDTSIKKTVSFLKTMFDTLCLSGQWDNERKCGNPCRARIVQRYVSNTKKEQLAAGVTTKQAMVFHLSIYDRMIAYCMAQAATPGASRSLVFEWIQRALQFALLYNTYNRGCNICAIEWSHLTVCVDHERRRALRLVCPMAKTASASGARNTIVLRDTGIAAVGQVPLIEIYDAFVALADNHEVDYASHRGFMFRKSIGEAAVEMPTACLRAGLQTVADALGLSLWGITIHSFRGSGAIAALQAGVSPSIVMYVAGWATKEMMEYYTQLRQMLNYTEEGEGLISVPVLDAPMPVPTLPPAAGGKEGRESFTAGAGKQWRKQ